MNSIKHKCLILFSLSVLFAQSVLGQQATLKDKDQICFIGNSITMNGGFFHNIALFYATRYPKAKVNVINCGVGGNMAANVISRMDSDILIHHPNLSVIMLGMNDVHRELYAVERQHEPGIEIKRQQALDTYKKNYETIIQTLLKNNSRIILQTPSIYDETAAFPGIRFPGRNGALQKCRAYILEFAEKYKLQVVDYWTIMQDITKKLQSKDSTVTIIGKDRVHPGAVGHFIMGYQFLKTTIPASQVSSLVLNAAKPSVSGQVAVNAKLSDLKISNQAISFTCLENALPFPITPDIKAALNLVPFSTLNKEMLQVSGLMQGNYTLKIDGINIGKYTEAELGQGIDLSPLNKTPQNQQAIKVLALFRKCWSIEAKYRWMRAVEFGRLRNRKIFTYADAENYLNSQIKAVKDTTTAAYKNLLSMKATYLPAKATEKQMVNEMQNLHELLYKAAQPGPHQYTISKL